MIGIVIPAIYALVLLVLGLLIDNWTATVILAGYGGVGLAGVALLWWMSSAEPTAHGVHAIAWIALAWLIGWPVLLFIGGYRLAVMAGGVIVAWTKRLLRRA